MKSIGLVGFGFIGSYLFEHLKVNNTISVAAIWDPDTQKTKSLNRELICNDLNNLVSRPLDLIVEAAHADVVKELWPLIRPGTDLLISSLTSLADTGIRKRMDIEALNKNQKIFIPHGAVLGLDGLRDGRNLIETVKITTTKHPKNLGLSDRKIKKSEIIFEGSTLEACSVFPRNVNVHAAIALAGIGFEATQSIVIADPDTKNMRHRIEVGGHGLNWNLQIESFSAGTVTGSYTPESIYQSILSILSGSPGFRIV